MASAVAASIKAPAAATTPAAVDPSTLSARERIRLHVQRNIQQQQAKEALLAASQPPAAQQQRKRALPVPESSSRKGSGDSSPNSWETNTPPTSAVDMPAKRRVGPSHDVISALDDSGDFSHDAAADDLDHDDGMEAPPIGMDVGDGMYANPAEDEGADPDAELGLCDSPPYEQEHQQAHETWATQSNEDAVTVPSGSETQETAAPAEHAVDDDWVKGIYEMEGMK